MSHRASRRLIFTADLACVAPHAPLAFLALPVHGSLTAGAGTIHLATGSLPLVLAIPGVALEQVIPIKKNVDRLAQALEVLGTAGDVAIVGRGLIGLETADQGHTSDDLVFLSQLCHNFVTMSIISSQYAVDRSRYREELLVSSEVCRRR